MIRLLSSTETLRGELQVGVGLVAHPDVPWASMRASAMARAHLTDGRPDVVLLVTAGDATGSAAATTRAVLGGTGLAGGATSALLSDEGPVRSGALVVCVADAEGATSGAAAAPGRTLTEASESAARLILSGWSFRRRYPRGLGVAFARPGLGAAAGDFLGRWRTFMGAKMRTVCSILSGPVLYGSEPGAAAASVACLEGAYAMGLGYTGSVASAGDGSHLSGLIEGAAAAAATAVKQLQGRRARLVMVVENESRYRTLGPAAAAEWSAMRTEIGGDTPTVGWLCEHVAAYGRGLQPVDAEDSLVVVALGGLARG